ncbi:hypothetical protein [Photobacterium damselae]|uniref:hypothetical protein n=1 Tax=Photobacterium damselae TaxID=38293 RepID=UPI001F42DE13|nr:hypothetical protein [Photobacterium damselae]UKA04962.1 hypothetical protein IHC89_22210 [Photobacterium damselae subsp. damselae]
MSLALICGSNIKTGNNEPIDVLGLNIDESFFTNAPSIRAAFGFAQNLTELDGLKYIAKGMVKKGIKINRVALLLHDFKRDVGTVGFTSATMNYINSKDTKNPPRPLETGTATGKFSLVIDYDGKLPDHKTLDCILNGVTARYNGGTVLNYIDIVAIDDLKLTEYLSKFKAWQVVDRSDLKLTTFKEMLEYVSFYKNEVSGKMDLKRHSGIFYMHQTGYQLLEDPVKRVGAVSVDGNECKHAYCEPIINIAELKHSRWIGGCDDLCFWERVSNKEKRTSVLTRCQLC